MKKPNHKGEASYKLYSGNMNPERYVTNKAVDGHAVSNVLKKDKQGRITLDRRKVRSLHGRSWIKVEYKRFRNAENENHLNKK